MRPDLQADIAALIAEQGLPADYVVSVKMILRPLAGCIAAVRESKGRTVAIGVCGSQGSGKSTAAAFLKRLLEARGMAVAVLSLDDIYLSRAARAALATKVHPLFATRGVPGTHDVALGIEVLDALGCAGAPLPLPRFDKAADAPTPEAAWPRQARPVDVVLFEGWCVGARPQAAASLDAPVNALECEDDAQGLWRGEVNARLAGDYQDLFARLDLLVLLKAPGFEVVRAWRGLQEHRLAERLRAAGDPRPVMNEAALDRFIAHYERLTRHILTEMPGRADVVIALDVNHRMIEAACRVSAESLSSP